MTLYEIFEKLKMEHAQSLAKHGKWKDLPAKSAAERDWKQHDAIEGEFNEWCEAFGRNDINGEHGEIEELIDLMNVAARRIMVLTGEDQ